MRELGAITPLLLFSTPAFAVWDHSANPLSGLFGAICGLILVMFIIYQAIRAVVRNPVRGSFKIISFLVAAAIVLILPLFVARALNLNAFGTIICYIAGWFFMNAWFSLHEKIFPEDGHQAGDKER